MTQIIPYLNFRGNCREVITFYKDCIGGELTILIVKDSPMAKDWPAAVQQNVLHASLAKQGLLLLLGSDVGGPGQLTNGNTISISLNCSNEEETKNYFSALSSGAEVTRPLHQFFGGMIGALTDKYGMNWIFYCDKKPAED